MTTQKIYFDKLEQLGAKAFLVCDRYSYDTLQTGIGIDEQTVEALIAILRGQPLEDALSHIDDQHLAAALVVAELTAVYNSHSAGAAA